MALLNRVNLDTLIGSLGREINKLDESSLLIMNELSVIPMGTSNKEAVLRSLVIDMYNNVHDFTTWWNRYINMFNEVAYKDDAAATEMRVHNSQIIESCSKMASIYNEIIPKLQMIFDAISTNSTNINILAEANDKVITALDEASASVVYNRATKVKGEHNPNTKRSIDTAELIHDYIKAGHVLTSEIVDKYNSIQSVTYHGLRKRLVDAGVWQSRQ